MRVIAILIATTLLASCGIADWANNTFPTYHNRKCTGWWCDESDWERNSQPSSSGAGAYPRRSVGGGSAPSPYGGAPSPYGSAPAQGTGGSYGMPPSAPSPYSGGGAPSAPYGTEPAPSYPGQAPGYGTAPSMPAAPPWPGDR